MAFIDVVENICGENSFLTFAAPSLSAITAVDQDCLKALIKTEQLKSHIRKAKLPISGEELINEFGLSPSSLIGEILSDLKTMFRQELWSTKKEAFNIVKKRLNLSN
jgi:hypothetical protein